MGKNRKRKRPYGESASLAYSSVSFELRKPTDGPRTPHSFFSSSYAVCLADDEKVADSSGKNTNNLVQVVHLHVNGLCIVTVGDYVPSSVKSIEYLAKEAPASSASEKRKRQAKMLKGGSVEDTVSPSTVIAKLNLEGGESMPVRACVWGTILELNHSITPEILSDDPLLEGYLAVILPSGSFPPTSSHVQTNSEADADVDDETGKRACVDGSQS